MSLFYISAVVAITGAVGYQFFVKRVPVTLNPVVSVIAMYIVVLVLGVFLLLFFPAEGGLWSQIHQVNWIQIVLAACVTMGQLSFLLMYRYGWSLSTGNIVAGVFLNIILVGLGVTLLGEKIIQDTGYKLKICFQYSQTSQCLSGKNPHPVAYAG